MSLLESIRRWWAKDRIRIAPDQGRLLGLQTGHRVVLDEELFVIAQRNEISTANRAAVRYLLTRYPATPDEHEHVSPPLAIREHEAPVVIDSRDPAWGRTRETLTIDRDSDRNPNGDRVWMECST